MAAPTPRSTTTPFERLTLSQFQEEIAVNFLGVKSWSAGLSSPRQAQVLRFLDDGHDRVAAEGLGHRPWFRRIAQVTLVADQETYQGPAGIRRVIAVNETIGGKTRGVFWIPEENYEMAWDDQLATNHPLNSSDQNQRIHWHFKGYDNTEPPRWIIQRTPTASSAEAGGTLNVVYRPYLEAVDTSGVYVEAPAEARRAVGWLVKMYIAANDGDDGRYALAERQYEQEIRVLQLQAYDEAEEGLQMQLPGDFLTETSF